MSDNSKKQTPLNIISAQEIINHENETQTQGIDHECETNSEYWDKMENKFQRWNKYVCATSELFNSSAHSFFSHRPCSVDWPIELYSDMKHRALTVTKGQLKC